MALERGIAPDDEAIRQIIQERNSPLAGMSVEAVRWPEEPLRSAMIRTCSGIHSAALCHARAWSLIFAVPWYVCGLAPGTRRGARPLHYSQCLAVTELTTHTFTGGAMLCGCPALSLYFPCTPSPSCQQLRTLCSVV